MSRGTRYRVLIAAAALLLVASGCGGSSGDQSDVAVTPSAATSPAPLAADAAFEITSVRAITDGRLLEVTLEVGAWLEGPDEARVFYIVEVRPEGWESARSVAAIQVGRHGDAATPSAILNIFGAQEGPPRSLEGLLEIDRDARRMRLVVPLPPDWPPIAMVSAVVTLANPERTGAERQGVVQPVHVARGEVAASLPPAPSIPLGSPVAGFEAGRIDASPVENGMALSTAGLPVTLVVPSDWNWESPTPPGEMQVQDARGEAYVGIGPRETRRGETASLFLQRIIEESGGAYARVDLGLGDPAPFEAWVALYTERDFAVGEAPGRALQNWQSIRGNVLILATRRHGEVMYLAFVEAPSAEAVAPLVPLLGSVRFE